MGGSNFQARVRVTNAFLQEGVRLHTHTYGESRAQGMCGHGTEKQDCGAKHMVLGQARVCNHSTRHRLPQAMRVASGPFFRPVGPALEDSKGLATVTLRTSAHKPERHRGPMSLF